jgi:nucleotide-binding universal stress UspA family protein
MQRYLLAVDGSTASLAAARWLGGICRAEADDEVILLHVFDPAAYYARVRQSGEVVQPLDLAMEDEGKEVFERVLPALGLEPGRVRTRVRIGRPEEQILRAAELERATAIVLGRPLRPGWGRLFRAGVGERLLRGAPCPVVAVAAPAAA